MLIKLYDGFSRDGRQLKPIRREPFIVKVTFPDDALFTNYKYSQVYIQYGIAQ
nr:hypothetical protein [Escherichia coli]